MVQNCPRCGTPNTPGHRYCSNCGAQIIEAEVSTPEESGRAQPPAARQPIVREVPPPVDPLSASMRADLPPDLGERSGEATYVPYADDVARALEKPKSNEKWLVRIILIAAGILVVLVAITIYLALRKDAPASDSGVAGQNQIGGPTATVAVVPTPTPGLIVVNNAMQLPCVLPLGATPEQEVMYTVCRSSEEQIKAWRDLDTEVLKGSRTGSDLQDNIKKVEKFKADKQYAEPVMHQLVITALRLDAANAIVKTSEVWSVTTYNSTDKSVVNKSGPTPYTETYHLVKLNGKWYLEKVVFDNLPKPPGD